MPGFKRCDTQKSQGEKPRWRPRNGCDGILMAKTLITTIQAILRLAPKSPKLSLNFLPLIVKLMPLQLLTTYNQCHTSVTGVQDPWRVVIQDVCR